MYHKLLSPLFALTFLLAQVSEVRSEFVLSGTTITQTGDDTDYSGLEALGLNPDELFITYSGERTHHIITGYNLVVEGDLVVDGANHQLSIIADNGDALIVSGLYEITTEHENSGFIDSVAADVLSVRNNATANNMRALYVQGSGLFKMKGGVAHLYTDSNHSLRTQDGASVHATDCTIIMNRSLRLHNNGSDTRFNNVVYRANATALTRAPIEWNNVRALQGALTPVTTPEWDNVGWSPLQINSQYTNWNNEIIYLTDAQNGMRHQFRAGLIKTDGGSVTVARKRFNINVSDSLGLPAGEDVFVWIKSPDNGNRFDYQQAYLSGYNTTDDVIDVYNLDGDGNTGIQYYNYRIGRSVEGGVTNHVMQNDFYTKSTSTGVDAEAKIDLSIVGYLYNLQEVIDYDLIGAGIAENSYSLVADTLVTETNSAVTALQTQQDTAAEAYDGLKYQLVANYAGETQTIVDRLGTLLDCRGYDVVINGAGSGLPTFDGATITINSSNFQDSITTTGTVTNKNLVSGSVLDATQDFTLSEVSGAVFSVYSSEADRASESNALATNVTSYAAVLSNLPSSTVYLSSVFGVTRIPFTVDLSLGANLYDGGIAGLLLSQGALLNDVIDLEKTILNNTLPNSE